MSDDKQTWSHPRCLSLCVFIYFFSTFWLEAISIFITYFCTKAHTSVLFLYALMFKAFFSLSQGPRQILRVLQHNSLLNQQRMYFQLPLHLLIDRNLEIIVYVLACRHNTIIAFSFLVIIPNSMTGQS